MLLLEAFLGSDVLAIESRTWSRLVSLMELEARGATIGEAEITARLNAAVGRSTPSRSASSGSGNVAVIGVTGLMFYRSGFLGSLLGWRGTAEIARDVRAATEAPGVSAIVLEIDSPGGEVAGTEELAATIADATRRKPVTAAVNTVAGSAAFWVASQATEIVISPSGQAGGIGVIATHQDLSTLAERLGIKTTFVSAGRFKSEGNNLEPLGPEARASLQTKVDSYYRTFVDTVARGRGVTADMVRNGFGEGRMVLAREAVARRMADRVASFDQVLARVVTGTTTRSVSASSDLDAVDLDLRRRRHNLAALTHPPPLADADIDRRRRRHALAELTPPPRTVPTAASDLRSPTPTVAAGGAGVAMTTTALAGTVHKHTWVRDYCPGCHGKRCSKQGCGSVRHAASSRCAKHTTTPVPVDVPVVVDVPAGVVTAAAPTPRLRILTFSYPRGVLLR